MLDPDRPRIGINGSLDMQREPKLLLATCYANAILKAAGVPLGWDRDHGGPL